MKKKVTILGIITLLALGVFAGCTSKKETTTAPKTEEKTMTEEKSDDQQMTDQDEMATDEVLRVGTGGGYPPYTFVDDQNNLTGFDIDVWTEIAKRLDMKIEFKTAAFSGLFGMLDNDQIDTIANQITITEPRLEKYIFTAPYVYNGAQLVVKEDSDIATLEDVKGKKVGVSLGSNYEQILREYSDEIEVVTYEAYAGSLQDVALGRIDAVLNDSLANKEFIQKTDLPLKLGGEPVSEVVNAFPFRMTDANKAKIEKINKVMNEMAEDGTLTEISLKYFPIDITKK